MKGKAYKGILMAGTLAIAIGVSETPFPAKACVFLQEFEKSSKSGAQVSVWERIVYSLIEAKNQTTQQHAPHGTSASA
jgi:hypothetical protein